MSAPIKSGDLCEIIDGLNGKDSPNIGLIVVVLSYVGDHSKFGRIWRVKAEYGVRGQEGNGNAPPGTMDCAQNWLKKIEPPKKTENTSIEKAASL